MRWQKEGMPLHTLFMEDHDIQIRLNKTVDVMVGIDPENRPVSRYGWAIDVSKPNIHDSKPEFLRERDAVAAMVEHAETLLDFIVAGVFTDDASSDEMNRRVALGIDNWAREKCRIEEPKWMATMIAKNASDTGLSISLAFILTRYKGGLAKRQMELADQEREFWSGASRPPNHYARTIGLRLARLYAQEKRELPTVGVSGDGGHPSTAFTRALQEVFELLKINSNIRNAASWAVAQLSDHDIGRPTNAFRGLMDYMAEQPPNALAVLTAEMKEKGLRD